MRFLSLLGLSAFLASLGSARPHEIVIAGDRMALQGDIVFSAGNARQRELYRCGPEGEGLKRLTRHGSLCVSPAVRAGTIAYTSYRSGWPDVYVQSLSGGPGRPILQVPGTSSGAALSPTGERLALVLSRHGNPELYLTNTRGSGLKQLTRTYGLEASPAWAPDGQRLVYVASEGHSPQLYILSASGGKPSLVPTGKSFCADPSWSPDGRRLAFAVFGGGVSRIAVFSFADRQTRLLASTSGCESPAWGNNSRHLAAVRRGDVVLIDSRSDSLRTLVAGRGATSLDWGW
ncbi:MAG: hypothetical protein AAF555_09230 [Verrucomicrobiota bacterium]